MYNLIKTRPIVFNFIYSERAQHDESDRIQFFMNNALFRDEKFEKFNFENRRG